MHTSQRRSAGLGLALASAFAFGGSGVAAKPLIEAGLDPLHVVWLRVTGAALVMLPVAWQHRNLVRERPALLAGFGLFAVAGVQAFYFASISRIPSGSRSSSNTWRPRWSSAGCASYSAGPSPGPPRPVWCWPSADSPVSWRSGPV